MLKHKLVIKVGWRSKTPFCLIKSYSLCSVTLTYLTLQSVDAVKQTLKSKGDMDNAHNYQLHYKIACVHHERPNFYKSIYVVLKILNKDPHFLKCESRHAGSTSINVLNGTLSMVPLVWLLHVKWLLPACDSHLNVWKDILKISR